MGMKTTSSGPGTAGTAGAACVADAGGPGDAGAEGAGDGGAEGPGDAGGALSDVGAGGAIVVTARAGSRAARGAGVRQSTVAEAVSGALAGAALGVLAGAVVGALSRRAPAIPSPEAAGDGATVAEGVSALSEKSHTEPTPATATMAKATVPIVAGRRRRGLWRGRRTERPLFVDAPFCIWRALPRPGGPRESIAPPGYRRLRHVSQSAEWPASRCTRVG